MTTRKFDIGAHVKAGFRDWLHEQFPLLRPYTAKVQTDYPELINRLPEVYATTTLALETIADHSDTQTYRHYTELRRKFERTYIVVANEEKRDWTKLASDLCVILNELERPETEK